MNLKSQARAEAVRIFSEAEGRPYDDEIWRLVAVIIGVADVELDVEPHSLVALQETISAGRWRLASNRVEYVRGAVRNKLIALGDYRAIDHMANEGPSTDKAAFRQSLRLVTRLGMPGIERIGDQPNHFSEDGKDRSSDWIDNEIHRNTDYDYDESDDGWRDSDDEPSLARAGLIDQDEEERHWKRFESILRAAKDARSSKRLDPRAGRPRKGSIYQTISEYRQRFAIDLRTLANQADLDEGELEILRMRCDGLSREAILNSPGLTGSRRRSRQAAWKRLPRHEPALATVFQQLFCR